MLTGKTSYSDSSDNVATMGHVIYLNIKEILFFVILGAAILIALIYIVDLISSYSFGGSREARKRINRRKKEARKRNNPHF